MRALVRVLSAWLHVTSLALIGLGFGCAIVIAADEGQYPRRMWIMNVVWPLTDASPGVAQGIWARHKGRHAFPHRVAGRHDGFMAVAHFWIFITCSASTKG
ncbi:hypothetical protein ACVW1C_005001 [Bradyrhizobium sp. USDA 4011]